MEAVPQYDSVSRELFQSYLNDKSFDLVGQLKKLERKVKRDLGSKGKKALWFRLFKGDTLVTDLNDIERYVTGNDSASNIQFFVECVEIGLKEKTLSTQFS